MTDGRQVRDDDGRLAAAGTVRADLLDVLLEHPHYVRSCRRCRPDARRSRPDTSTTSSTASARSSGPDLLATLTELTAHTVARALAPYGVLDVVVSGGGVHNPSLMAALARNLGTVRMTASDELGIPADGKEAVMWALLGFLTWHGVPGSNPATGALEAARARPASRRAREPLRLPPPANAFHKRPRRLRVLTHVRRRLL